MIGEKVDIEVKGRRFQVEFYDLKPLEVQGLAAQLTERMERIERDTGIVDSGKLAIQAALNLLAEMTQLKAAQDQDRAGEGTLLLEARLALESALNASQAPEPAKGPKA